MAKKRKAKAKTAKKNRARGPQARLEALTKEHMQQGMDAASARQLALDKMRNNPRKDWRRG
jgi:hypothetical protein